MLGPLLNLIFLGCFWLAGSLALQLVREHRGEMLLALFGRGGAKRGPLPVDVSLAHSSRC